MKGGFFGAFVLASAAGCIAIVLPGQIPSESAFGPIARMLDSMTVFIVVLTLVGAIAIWLCGGRWTAVGVTVCALTFGGWIAATHVRLSLPVDKTLDPDVSVAVLNIFEKNERPWSEVVESVFALDTDFVVLLEASQLADVALDLPEGFRQITPCLPEACEIIIATRLEVRRHWMLALNEAFPQRYAVVEFETATGAAGFLSVAHLLKPWFSGLSEAEWAKLEAQYDWFDGPVLAVGDFNAAPWARPVQEILDTTRFRALRIPVGTWPALAGRFGIPIDQVFVHNEMRIVSARPFGEDLGSNHRGLIIEAAIAERE